MEVNPRANLTDIRYLLYCRIKEYRPLSKAVFLEAVHQAEPYPGTTYTEICVFVKHAVPKPFSEEKFGPISDISSD
jgi:hypothetical protein